MLQVNYREGCPLAQAIVDGLGGVLFQYPFKCANTTALCNTPSQLRLLAPFKCPHCPAPCMTQFVASVAAYTKLVSPG